MNYWVDCIHCINIGLSKLPPHHSLSSLIVLTSTRHHHSMVSWFRTHSSVSWPLYPVAIRAIRWDIYARLVFSISAFPAMTFGLLWRSLCWSFMSGMWALREVVREDLLDIGIVGLRDLVRIVMLRVWCFKVVEVFSGFFFSLPLRFR